MDKSKLNPINVGKAFLDILYAEFPHFSTCSTPNVNEKQVAELLLKKLAKITTDYQIVDEYENEFGQLVFTDTDFLPCMTLPCIVATNITRIN